ncbi:MAG TPA: hypothetical protein VG711_10765, partial [Phycisphaerales bacterium]|nr:hypothetical protein [Phycisphaerales bacterium]
MRTLTALLIFALAVPCIAADVPAPPASQPAQSQPAVTSRVILHVNRNLDLAGYVLSEDDDNISIRDLKNQQHDFNKTRITQIIRLVDPKPGQSGIVYLRNGQTREGVILEDAFDHVTLVIQSIRTTLKRDSIDYVVLLPTFEEQYEKFKAAVKPGMYEAHLRLCQWAVNQKRYDVARRELQELLDERETADARHLMNIVEAEIELHPDLAYPPGAAPHKNQKPASGSSATTPPVTPPTASPQQPVTAPSAQPATSQPADAPADSADNTHPSQPPSTAAEESDDEPDSDNPDSPDQPDAHKSGPVYPSDMLPRNTISSKDVNLIRVYEIDFDHPPKVAVSADTIRELLEKYGTSELIPASQTDRTALFRADPLEIVRLMFALRARDLYPKVQVLSEPQSLLLFKQRVHDTWLMNNCATSRCHGGVGAGRFYLNRHNYKETSGRVRYSNL